MGTNYYLQYASKMWDKASYFFLKYKNKMQNDGQIHIGKSSAGWTFTFRKYDTDELQVDTYAKWKEIIVSDEWEIVDEYSETIDYGSIIEFIVFETASEMFKGMDIDLDKLLKGE